MVQPKYSPEEALERIKLMMKYDSSKTLNENKKVIFEEEETAVAASTSTDANTVTVTDLMGDTGKLRQYYQMMSDFGPLPGIPNLLDIVGGNIPNLVAGRRNGVKGVVDALDGFVDLEDLTYVLTVIKSLDGKCYYDDVDEAKIPAIEKFLQLYNEDEDEDLEAEVEGVGIRTLPTGASDIKRAITREISKQKSQSCSSSADVTPVPTDGGNTGGGNTGGGTGGYKDCSGTYTFGCKSEAIRKVQGCLGGLTTDGKFGPNTQKALKAKGFDSFTDADVDKICGIDSIEDTDVQDVEEPRLNQI
jgi:hypothetical protein